MREQRNHKKRSPAQQQSLRNAWATRRNQVEPSRKENTVPDLGLKQPTLGKPVINYETRYGTNSTGYAISVSDYLDMHTIQV